MSTTAVVVAYSGGADSAFLAVVAHQALRDRAWWRSPPCRRRSPRPSGPTAAAFAAERGPAQVEVETDEMENAAYRLQRRRSLLLVQGRADGRAGARGGRLGTATAIALGVNLDDLGDHRPGQSAAAGRGAVFPLVDAGFTKADVRAASRQLGLRTWDKPAAPCLASRLPYGTAVDVALLSRVERAEAALHDLGLRRAAGAPRRRHGPDRGARRPTCSG